MKQFILRFITNIYNRNISPLAICIGDCVISKKAKIHRFCKLYQSHVDAYTYLSPGTELINTQIGKFCSIAKSVKIGLVYHTMTFKSTSPVFTSNKNRLGCYFGGGKSIVSEEPPLTIIENDVWIGENVMIKSGLRIGNGAVIGAGAVVTKDVPDYAIVGGVPAKVIRYRFEKDTVEKLVQEQWWLESEEYLKEHITDFQNPIVGNSINIYKK